MDIDMNLWGWFAVPVGVLIGFSPVIILWLIAELRGE